MADNFPAISSGIASGSWTLAHAAQLARLTSSVQGRGQIFGNGIVDLDTTGAMYLLRLADSSGSIAGLADRHQKILALVKSRLTATESYSMRAKLPFLARVGRGFLTFLSAFAETNGFLGRSALGCWELLRQPKLFRLKEFFVQLELCCLDAVPIVGLVTFLIGVVVAYLSAIQLEKYGANIFIVDGVALAMCRELSPIIVAIIVAGRSGSAFTAHLGTMKLNEEIDALETLGLSPLRVLVLPRVFALIIAMPLLVFVGDMIGIAGGAFIANSYLNITMPSFLDRLQSFLQPKHFWVGLAKAPVFALFIALIGCRMGLNVENNARSIGLHTTSTVVQSIVAVIFLNATFAVILVELGI